MKKYVATTLLFIAPISLLNGKPYTFIPMETNGNIRRECDRIRPGFIIRNEEETICDELERILKEHYKTGKMPRTRKNHGGWNLWGTASDMFNSDGTSSLVYKLLEDRDKDTQTDSDQEIYDLSMFLAKNSPTQARTLKEQNEKEEERLIRLKKEFKEEQRNGTCTK
jgi:hypothetical protein